MDGGIVGFVFAFGGYNLKTKTRGCIMGTQSSIVRARVDTDIKAQAVKALSEMGLSLSDAIRLMLSEVVANKSLPFDIKTPNQTTIDTFEATDNNLCVTKCENAEDMFEKLGI